MTFMSILSRLPMLASILLTVTTFVRLIRDTKVDLFFRWIHLGGVLDFIYDNYNLIAPVLVAMLLFKWIKDWRILAGIGFLVFLFVTFAL